MDNVKSDYTGISQGYQSGGYQEAMRLHVQEKFGRELDTKLLCKARLILDRWNGLTALDVGCADGYVTQARLTRKEGFVRTVGIDHDERALSFARQRQESGFSYYQADVESADFPRRMQEIMEEEKIASFDVIYSALTLHHLRNRVSVLRQLNKFLSPGGVVLLRGVDDGAQFFYVYGEDGEVNMELSSLLEGIIRFSLETPGMSNRLHGRQLYAWLRQAGYREIHSEYAVADTVGLSFNERIELYQYMLAFRGNYTKRAMERDPDSQYLKNLHEKMTKYLEKIKQVLLEDENAYYMITSFGMVARKY